MSESAIRENIRKIRDKQINFARQQQEFQEDYNTRRQQELGQIQKLINQIIHELVTTEFYDLILSDGVIWANDKVDITDKVLRQLQQKHRSERKW
jgi:outer membrane protein